MLRAAAYCLHRRPHVPTRRQKVPARAQEVLGVDFSAFVNLIDLAVEAALDRLAPRDIAVSLDDGMAAAEIPCLFGIERRVNAPIHDHRTAFPRNAANFVPTQGVACVDADADDVTGVDRGWVELFEGLVSDERVAIFGRRGCR